MRITLEPLVLLTKPAPGGGVLCRIDGGRCGAEAVAETWPQAAAAALRELALKLESEPPPPDDEGLTSAQLHALLPYGPFRPEGEGTVVELLLALARRVQRLEDAAKRVS
jgi:hypothetical protein